MSDYRGDYDVGATFRFTFMTVNASGVPTTLGNSPSLAYLVDDDTTLYTSGLTLTTDFASKTGLNHVKVLATTSATALTSGINVSVIIAAGTVSGVSMIGWPVGEYSLKKDSALKPATAARTLVVDANGLADANMVKMGPTGSGTAQTARDIGASVLLSSGTGTGQVKLSSGYVAPNWGDVGNPTTSVSLTNTTIATVTTVTNQLTAAAIATGVWQDATAGDFTTASSIGKALYINNVAPGGAGGHFISGSNSGTTTVGALTVTGAFSNNGVTDVAQTGDSFARIGATGSGLTSLAPASTALSTADWTGARAAKLDNLDAAISTRMATFTLPTNFSALAITAGGAVTAGTVSDKTGYVLSAIGSAALTEDYAADGATGTLNQMLYHIQQSLDEFAISGTTRTVKKLDGSTTAMTFTLDSATFPTSTTRST